MYNQFEELTPYKKKKKKKVPKKANHKHDFKNCVYVQDLPSYNQVQGFAATKTIIGLGSYCSICGKINLETPKEYLIGQKPHIFLFLSELTEEAKKELDPTTRTIPTFTIDQSKQKSVF